MFKRFIEQPLVIDVFCRSDNNCGYISEDSVDLISAHLIKILSSMGDNDNACIVGCALIDHRMYNSKFDTLVSSEEFGILRVCRFVVPEYVDLEMLGISFIWHMDEPKKDIGFAAELLECAMEYHWRYMAKQ